MLFVVLQLLSGGEQHAAERERLLRAYEERPQSRSSVGNPLCLQRLQLERDLVGALATASVPPGGGLRQEEESIDADELAKGQFERMPRIGARGFGPSILFHNVFAGACRRFSSRHRVCCPGTPRRALAVYSRSHFSQPASPVTSL